MVDRSEDSYCQSSDNLFFFLLVFFCHYMHPHIASAIACYLKLAFTIPAQIITTHINGDITRTFIQAHSFVMFLGIDYDKMSVIN